MTGKTEQSATVRPEVPSTSRPGLTTERRSAGSPIRQVPQWWL